jgi:homoserine O-acetyltransferase/O-succinyltransferase
MPSLLPLAAASLLALLSFDAAAGGLGKVEDQFFTMRDSRLRNGTVMPEVKLAYETYGTLSPDGRNPVLVTHGYTSSHHAADRNPANGDAAGWWDGLIGPEKAIDTNRLFVVSSNMLGSSFGSTNGANVNPGTGMRYGPDFPAIRLGDIVAAEKALLDGLGVKHLVAVAGPSYGGYQAFQWAVTYPEIMDGIVAVATAPRAATVASSVASLESWLATDPHWNGGWYYDGGGPETLLTKIRVEALKRYRIEAVLKQRYPDPTEREAQIKKRAQEWAQKWDANSLVILRRATVGFDTVPDFPKIKAKVLYVLCRSDLALPPTIAPQYLEALNDAGVDARYFEINSDFGHVASGYDHAKWSSALREFLAPLIAKLL